MSIWGGRYIPGQNWVECDICGFKVRAGQTRYNSDGLLVCIKDWEPEHPQDYLVESRTEKIVPDKVRVHEQTVVTDYELNPDQFENYDFDFYFGE